MDKSREKVIELKVNEQGVYEACGESYVKPEGEKPQKKVQTPTTKKIALPIHNEKIQNTLDGMRAGLVIFRELKRLLK